MEKMKKKSILVISNNAFSSTDNNGKTIASILESIKGYEISQLYFNPKSPSALLKSNFFSITDNQMIDKFLNKTSITNKSSNSGKSGTHGHFKRLLREIIWRKKYWNTDELNNWLDRIKPTIILFVAGDSGFAYNITKYVHSKYKTKLITYITDDYILNNFTLNIFEIIRTYQIKKKLLNLFSISTQVLTISPVMEEKYRLLYGLKSRIMANKTKYLDNYYKEKKNEKKIILYAGGLHYGRLRSIILLAKKIKQLKLDTNYEINVYTNSNYSPQKINKLTNVLKIYEGIDEDSLKHKYSEADVLLFVESFKRKHIKKTKLSFSTKIPEYISIGKPILTIGPKSVGSVKFLSDISHMITKKRDFETTLKNMFKNPNFEKKLIRDASSKIDKTFNTNFEEILEL